MTRTPRALGASCGLVAAAIAFAFQGLSLRAQSPPASAPAGPASRPAPPATHKIAKGGFAAELKLSGVFEANRAAEIVLSPEAWTELRVRRAVEHGSAVRKGDALVELDTKKIDKALTDKAGAVEAGAISLKQAEEELRNLERSTPEQLALAARVQQRAAEDLERFTKIDRPLAEKAGEQGVRNYANALEYTKEELRQLEKMYKADDLTEETEEIVLKRQRDAVARAEFALQQARTAHEQKLKVDLPRQVEDSLTAKQARDAERASKDVLLPLALAKKRLDVAKMRADQGLAEQELANLRKDRGAMTVKAPMAGIVYYGQCVRGQWTTAAQVAGKLVPGGLLVADQVVMTVVEPRAMVVRATVPEKDLHLLRKGLPGKAAPTGFPDRAMNVELASFSLVPNPAGQFDAQLAVAGDAGPLRPGMTCSVTLEARDAPDAVVLPAAAVFAEPDRPGERFVYLQTPGRPQKRVVKVGRTRDGKVEIVEGLQEGEVVFLQRPE